MLVHMHIYFRIIYKMPLFQLNDNDESFNYCKTIIFTDRNSNAFDKIIYYLGHIASQQTGSYNLELYSNSNGKVHWVYADKEKRLYFTFGEYMWSAFLSDDTNTFKVGSYSKDTITRRQLTIETDAPYPIINQFVLDAYAYYEKCFETIHNNLSFYTYDARSDYWEICGELVPRDLETIYLPTEDILKIITAMDNFRNPFIQERKMKLGIPHKHVYLFDGLPGTGKTSLIRALATKYNASVYVIPITNQLNDQSLLKAVRQVPINSFVVFEDIDSLFTNRQKNPDNPMGLTFSGLLNTLDGLLTNNLEIFMTTNHKEKLDHALIRAGRVDLNIRFTYAIEEQIKKMFKTYTTPSDDQLELFWNNFVSLNVKVTIASLQQYLEKYIDDPNGAIFNLFKLKELLE